MTGDAEVKIPYEIKISIGPEAEREAAQLISEVRIALCGAIRSVGKQWSDAGLQVAYTAKEIQREFFGSHSTNGAIHEIKHAILSALKAPR